MIKFKIKVFLFFLVFLFLLNPVYSEYLGNLEFDIQDGGQVLIYGNTDYPDFDIIQTDKLTSKNQEYWIFELNTPIFQKYYYSIILPENIQINYINSPNNVRITNKNKRIQIISTGEYQNIEIKIQYIKVEENNNLKFYFYAGGVLGIIIGLVFVIFSFLRYKKNTKNKTEKSKQISSDSTLDELNDRQKEIIEILKSKKIITQHYLLKELKIPKSSLSRNLKSLETKDIIEIKRYGITNKISLKNK